MHLGPLEGLLLIVCRQRSLDLFLPRYMHLASVDVAMALLTNVTVVNNIVGRIAHVLIQPDICAADDRFREHSPTFVQMYCKMPVTLLLDCPAELSTSTHSGPVNALMLCMLRGGL